MGYSTPSTPKVVLHFFCDHVSGKFTRVYADALPEVPWLHLDGSHASCSDVCGRGLAGNLLCSRQGCEAPLDKASESLSHCLMCDRCSRVPVQVAGREQVPTGRRPHTLQRPQL